MVLKQICTNVGFEHICELSSRDIIWYCFQPSFASLHVDL